MSTADRPRPIDRGGPVGVTKSINDSSLSLCSASVKSALQANLALQATLTRRIERIASLKAANRQSASEITSFLLWTRENNIDGNNIAGSKQENATLAGGRRKIAKKWRYNEDRKWTRRFFVDPDGSVPSPNSDTLRRREIEATLPLEQMNTPWSKSQLDRLRRVTEQIRKEQLDDKKTQRARRHSGAGHAVAESDEEEEEEIIVADAEIDFEKVAARMKERHGQRWSQQKPGAVSSESSTTTTSVHRSAIDCRIKFLTDVSSSINKSKFTREESLHILEWVHTHNGQPPWDAVAASLPTPNRTAWQCFHTYQTKLNPNLVSRPWTPEEDELLLKYIAAMGPQFVLNINAASKISSKLFPDRSAQQILFRAHASLVNPKYVHGVWKDDEERRLVLAMKVYRDAPSSLTKVANHFPNRSTKSVSEKWNRSLNPDFTVKPFTEKEDNDLLKAVKRAGGAGNWKEVAKQFPNRNSHTLLNRWMELASDDEVLKKYGDALVKATGARKGTVGGSGSEALLRPDDFVVRVKKPGTKSFAAVGDGLEQNNLENSTRRAVSMTHSPIRKRKR